MKKTPLNKVSKAPYSTLLREAKKVFNAWIRARDAKKLGGKCYTCPNPGDQAGHFRHNNNATRFSEIFVNLQCLNCNQYKSGNLGVYALNLIKEHGLKKVTELERDSYRTKRFSRSELQEIVAKYSQST